MKILLCYDGSPDSEAAIDFAGSIFSGCVAVVLTVWEGFSEVLLRAGSGMAVAALDFERIDAESEQAARQRADTGVARAQADGMEAEPRVAERSGSTWATILDQADSSRADVIVVGSRGLTGIKSLLLGSVPHGVLGHADRPVLVVSSDPVASSRSAGRHRGQALPAT